ncbi:hypothetical protein [Rhodococcus koreensis]|uniref:PPE family protein n=1 Tax=Rhodococcus koreensis TaxID=99653 RepID=A0A1H4YEL5_9NOCA|nr:hypothetical protein [Rhodococcus koreensis]SED15528.1 hypothetical protein SAMN04490239_7051 [Rhodococcus koreensis]
MPPNDVVSTILDSINPNGAGEQRRTGLQNSADKLTAGSGTDEPYIRTMESFHGMDHEEMYAKAQTMVPDAISQLAQACHSISNALPLAFGFAILRNTISERWEGAAADAAAQATEKLAATSGQLTSSIAAIAVKLDILSSAAADVKASVPQPASAEGVLSQLPLSPLAAERSETEREAARLEAVRRLEAIYVPNYRDVGTNVPQLPEPYTPSGDGSGSGGMPSSYGTVPQGSNPWNTSDSSTFSAPSDGDASVNGETPGAEGSAEDDAATTSAANAEAAANQGAGAGSGSAAQTAAANAQNAAGAGSQSGNGAGGAGYGGIAGGSGAGASGAGGSGVGGSASSTRRKNDKRESESNSGAVVPGGPIPSGGAAAGAGAAAAAAAATPVKPSMSRPGMGMAPGMMGAPGRAGGNGEGDTEHQTPSYLITVDNGNDLIGKLDPVAPPVIGA